LTYKDLQGLIDNLYTVLHNWTPTYDMAKTITITTYNFVSPNIKSQSHEI